jgi:hypothetical protein
MKPVLQSRIIFMRLRLRLRLKNLDAAPAAVAPAPAPTLLQSKAKFFKRTKVETHVKTILFIWFCTIYFAENLNWMGNKMFYFVSFFNS